MTIRDEEISILNSLLQKTYIEIDSYERCLNKIKDKEIRHALEYQELEQKRMASELASRIRDIGGTPKDGPGTKGALSSIMGSLKLAENEDTIDILDMLHEESKSAVQSQEQSLNRLAGKSRGLVEKHLEEEKRNAEEIYNFKNNIIH